MEARVIRRRLAARLRGLQRFARPLLTLAGFGCLTAAAWTWSVTAGLAAAGLSLLVVEALSGSEDDEADNKRPKRG